MSINRLLVIAVIVGLVAVSAYALQIDHEVSFEDLGSSKKLGIPFPNVELTASENEALYQGKPIAKLLEGREGLKIGWLRFFANSDPVSAWYIISDVEHFSLEDPSYPATGPTGKKRHTFMPYTFDCVACKVGDNYYAYQLIAIPLVSPRKYTILRHHNRNGFPWQSAWTLSDKLYCIEKRNPTFEKEFNEAILVLRNTGSYLVAPLPKEFRRSPNDLNRADVAYFVDLHPAGDLAKLKPIVNLAQKFALPEVANNVNFHGKNWIEHMKKYHSASELEEYKSLHQQYIDLYGTKFGQPNAAN